MAAVKLEIESPREPGEILEALTDFSERRPELWPSIDPNIYKVHELSTSSAIVTEGTAIMGGIWARELYEWNGGATVRATVLDSNFWHPGGTWELTAAPRVGGGSILKVTRERRAKNAKARLLEAMMRLVGAGVLAKELLKAPAISGQPVQR